MPRKLRVEYEGAIYHVICRGNYRADVFAADKTKEAFLRCLDEACGKAGWLVHAWCVMSNHYHLCIETPEPNLVGGMSWLQETFAVRFNRFRHEHGHLFQGRYKALPVDPEAAGAVCHYIHLNPVRAGIVSPAELGSWRWTRLRVLCRPEDRPVWYTPALALEHAGGLDDAPAGRDCYLKYLAALQESEPERRRLEFDRLSKDWAIGSTAFKSELLSAHREWATARRRGEAGPQEFARVLWTEHLGRCLAKLGKTSRDIAVEPKGSLWKVCVAATMKLTTTASNRWLSQQLNMGSPFRLSRLAGQCRKHPELYPPFKELCKVQRLTP